MSDTVSSAAAPVPSASMAWLSAARPKTLSLAVAPVLVGTALAHAHGHGALGPALAAALGAILIQIGTNLFNDFGDFRRGADNAERLGPARATQQGWLTPHQVLWGSMAAFAGATAAGVFLVAVAGWPIVAIGILSILSGLAYTGGPYPLAYVGAGDLFVFVFFGLVAVTGTYYIQTHALAWTVLVAAAPVGLLATSVLVVNNIRDRQTDAQANKRTLAVRFGRTFSQWQYASLLLFAYAIPVAGWSTGQVGMGWLVSCLSVPFAVLQVRAIWYKDGAALNPHLGAAAKLTTMYSALLAIGVLL